MREFASSLRAKFGRGKAPSRQPNHVRAEGRPLRRFRIPIALFAGAFALASGTVALAYDTTAGDGAARAQAVTLTSPGAGTVSKPTPASLSLSWGAASGLPSAGGYLVLRSTSSGGPYAKVSSGTCSQTITLVSAATSCTDDGLTGGTTYYYEVEAGYYDVDALWVSAPDSQFSGTTAPTAASPGPSSPGPSSPAPGNPGTSSQAPTITSTNSATFFVGTPGSFHVTASGSPAPTFSNAAFSGCTPSTLPSGVTFDKTGLLSGTLGADAVGTYTLCVNASNGVNPNATQSLTLSIETEALVISSPAVSGAASNTPNLGPITVQRRTGSGSPITTGGAVAVDLTSSPSVGGTFGATQFAAAPVTSVTIPSGQSATTFWFGSSSPGGPTITASATGYVSGTQLETITTAPAGLGIILGTGSTGTPVISCGPPAASSTCDVTGVGTAGSVVVSLAFWNTNRIPVAYSATQAATINEAGDTGVATIGAGSSGSGPSGLRLPLGTATLSYGPYTLTIEVSP